jgi:hypothetical protein
VTMTALLQAFAGAIRTEGEDGQLRGLSPAELAEITADGVDELIREEVDLTWSSPSALNARHVVIGSPTVGRADSSAIDRLQLALDVTEILSLADAVTCDPLGRVEPLAFEVQAVAAIAKIMRAYRDRRRRLRVEYEQTVLADELAKVYAEVVQSWPPGGPGTGVEKLGAVRSESQKVAIEREREAIHRLLEDAFPQKTPRQPNLWVSHAGSGRSPRLW